MIVVWISNGLREFWVLATVFRACYEAFSKQYCLSEQRERVVQILKIFIFQGIGDFKKWNVTCFVNNSVILPLQL